MPCQQQRVGGSHDKFLVDSAVMPSFDGQSCSSSNAPLAYAMRYRGAAKLYVQGVSSCWHGSAAGPQAGGGLIISAAGRPAYVIRLLLSQEWLHV